MHSGCLHVLTSPLCMRVGCKQVLPHCATWLISAVRGTYLDIACRLKGLPVAAHCGGAIWRDVCAGTPAERLGTWAVYVSLAEKMPQLSSHSSVAG